MTIKDGDIFRWRYNDEKPADTRQYSRYHCKSQIAVAKDGYLIDTYWGGSLLDATYWSYNEAPQQLHLERLGNFADLEKRPDYHAMYYDDADCVDLRHPNSSRDNFYVRKGAQRSRVKMRDTVTERIEGAERAIQREQSKLDRLRDMLSQIDADKPLDTIYL